MATFISNFNSAFRSSNDQSRSKSSADKNDQRSDELADEIDGTDANGAGAVAGGAAATLAVLSGLLKPSDAAARTITSEHPDSTQKNVDVADSRPQDVDLAPVIDSSRQGSDTDTPVVENSSSAPADLAATPSPVDLNPSLVTPVTDIPEQNDQNRADVEAPARTTPQAAPKNASEDTPRETADANPEAVPADIPQIESSPPGQPEITVLPSVTEAAGPQAIVGTIETAGTDTTFHIVSPDGTIIDHPVFEINGTNIQVRPGAALDFEEISEFDLNIIASNGDGQSTSTQITLTISDEAEEIQLDDGGVTFIDIGVTETSVTGGSGNDQITGSAGQDVLAGAGGDDALDGGAGADTAVFTGNWADYTITQDGSKFTVTDNRPGSPDGTDTLEGIETLSFADGDVAAADALNDAPEINATAGTVTENVTGATVGTAAGTDADAGETLTYSVDDRRFEVVDGDLKLRDDASLDFETDGDALTVVVTVTDAHGASESQTVTVTLSDEAEEIQLDDGGATFTDTHATEISVTGGTGNDTINGSTGDDTLAGDGGDDVLTGGTGDDRLTGGTHDDTIDGGAGSDTAVWDGDLADFAVSYDSDTGTFTIADQNTGDADEGTDTVTDVETFSFNGVEYSAADLQTEAARQANTGPGAASVASGGSVAENSAEGTVVATLTATDVDGDALNYAITDAAGNPVTDSNFEIVGNEIRVKPGADIDFETADSHDIYLTAADAFETSTPTQITLTVSDVAEVIQLGNGTGAIMTGTRTRFGHDGESFTDTHATEISVTGGTGNDTINGSTGDDTLAGDGGDDVLTGGTGDDRLTGGTHDDTIDGGAGSDTAVWDGDLADFAVSYDSDTGTFTITDQNTGDADEGTDTVTGVETFSFNGVTYSAADLETEAARQANTGPGAASVASGGSVAENSAEGTVVATLTATDVDGDTPSYAITDAAGNAVTDSNFEIVGNEIQVKPGADIDFEAAAAHELYVTVSDAFETSAPQPISVTVSDTAETISVSGTFSDTGVGESSITGSGSADVITGHDDGAVIDGAAGDDAITGSAGDDTLRGGSGDDTVSGGAGFDTVLLSGDETEYTYGFDETTNEVIVTDANLADGDDGTDRLSDVELINYDIDAVQMQDVFIGTSGDDTLDLNSRDTLNTNNKSTWNQAFGGAGDDQIIGSSVRDNIMGGSGDDVIDGNGGSDTANWTGDLSDFAISYDDGPQVFTITDHNAGDGDEGTDTVTGVETFIFNGVTYSAADLETEAARQANTGPTEVSFASGGDVWESMVDGGSIYSAYDPSGSTVGTLQTADDAGDTHTYTIINDPSGHFDIVGDQIVVRPGQTIDYETNESIDVIIRVTDQFGESIDQTLTIDVKDISVSYATGNGGRTIVGTSEEDMIVGGTGNDTISGADGNDRIVGAQGDDNISGGDGHDIAYFHGDIGDSVISYDGATQTFTITDTNLADGLDAGTDTVTGVETFSFNGVTYSAADLENEAARQANTGPGAASVASGGGVAENSAEGTVVATLTAADVDGDMLSYAITDAGGNPVTDSNFEIVGNEIRVKPGADIDFETADSHDLYVTASDGFETSTPTQITLTVNDEAEAIQLGDGGAIFNDTGVTETSVTGGDGDDNITGSAGDDTLAGAAGDDTLTGSDGHDELRGWSGHDTLIGGAGDDTLLGASNEDTLQGDAGNDVLDGGTGDDMLSGGADDDWLTGGTHDDSLDGGDGSDTAVWDGDFADFAVSYDGDIDTFVITDENAGDADEGTDTVTDVETFSFNGVEYSAADLQTEAARQANTGPGAASVASGGSVAENSAEGTVVATLTATDVDGDTLTYAITDAAGNPVTDSNFEIVGNEIRVKPGADIDFETADSHDIYVTASDAFETSTPTQITLTVSDVAEVIQLADGGVTFIDTGVTETSVTGGSGDDAITGGGGRDNIQGGAGDDTISGGQSGDVIDGGEGSDTILLDDSDFGQTNIVTDSGSSGTDRIRLSTGSGTYRIQGDFSASSGVEIIDGSGATGDQLGTKDGSANFDFTDVTLVGVDEIIGTTADDSIIGSAGNDTITLDAGNDSVAGGDGNDMLDGGAGNDAAIWNGDFADFAIAYDATTDTFTITDQSANEGMDTVTGVETFSFNGVTYSAADLETEAARQANTGPGAASVASGGGVAENSAEGTVVATLSSTDVDGDTLNYAITDAAGNAVTDSNFEIVGNEIRVKPGADIDFETADSHDIYVTVSDAFETSTPTQITLTVSDVAEVIQLADGGVTFTDTGVTETSVTGGSGDDELYGGVGDDTFFGGVGDDDMSGGAGNDTFHVAAMEGYDTIVAGNDGGWTDVIDLQGMGSDMLVSGNTVDGDGWTMILDGGSAVTGQSGGTLDLAADAAGVITFDDGGTVDFAGVERITW